VPSASNAVWTRAAFVGRVERFEVIPYGIDAHWFAERPTRAGEGIADRPDPVIGTAARLAHQKSLHHLIDAMPAILARRPAARLVLFGDGPLRAPLEARATERGVAHAVRFAGFVPDIAPAYAALDVFVLPSRNEGLPISVLEAMAIGTPVVGSRVPGIVDLVRDEQTGLTFPYADPSALASAVDRLLGDAILRDRVRSNARKLVETQHARGAVARRMEALYAALVAEGSAG